jgi:hypothetical protein
MDQKILAALLRIEQLLAALLEIAAADSQDGDSQDDAPQYLNAPRK